MQKQAISEAKETIYNQFFQVSINSRDSRQDTSKKQLISQNSIAGSLNPHVSAVHSKARTAWYSDLKKQNSPITDLFTGQQTTLVKCQQCTTESYQFENFYSLPVPIPTNLNATFYLTIIRRCQSRISPTIVSYGVQITRKSTLQQLMDEIDKLAKLSFKYSVCELAQSKIYRTYIQDDLQCTIVDTIYKRTNQLFIYEINDEYILSPPKQELGFQKQKRFSSLADLEPGKVIEVQDKYSKWYVAIVTCCILGDINKVKIHYYHLNERWDEWFEESPETLQRLLPFGASG